MFKLLGMNSLKSSAEENWDLEIPFGGMRGNIIDRNGELIVGNN